MRRLEQLILERSVRHGDFVLASGRRSRYYIDCRLTTMSAEGLALVGREGLAAIRQAGWRPAAVGGLTLGADPVAYAIAAASYADPPAVDAFTVRKEFKEHGTGRLVEGNLRAGTSVVVVEDVLTTGGSTRRAIAAVEGERARVVGVLVVVDREEGGRAALEHQGYPVIALTTASALGLTA